MVRESDLFFYPRITLTPADIQTLARMTGKDFSGPVPIIKAPTPLRMVEDDPPVKQIEEVPAVRKKSRTPGLQPGNDAEEVLGDVDDYEDNE
jgi:transcription factor TFIIIB component B''